MRLLYIPHGNIPSRWAHSFQAMKMAEGIAGRVEHVTLLTRGGLLPDRMNAAALARWYGLRRPLRVVRLPLHLWASKEGFTDVGRRRFDIAAAAYARLTNPDLVYSRSVRAGCWCVRLGLRTIIEAHGVPAPATFDRGALLAVRDIAASPRLVGVVTVTDYLAQRYIELGLPAARISVWPDAVDLELFAAALPRGRARQRLGLPPDGTIVVYAGHLYPEKGALGLVEAARQLPAMTFCLVGGWPADIERLRRSAPENVRFLGFVPHGEIPDYLSAADLLVLPNSGRGDSAHATSPLKLFEYMASRRPIVATEIPAFCGILGHDENAWLVAPDAPEALAAGIAALAGEPEHGERLAAKAWGDVQRHTWDRRAEGILEAFGVIASR